MAQTGPVAEPADQGFHVMTDGNPLGNLVQSQRSRRAWLRRKSQHSLLHHFTHGNCERPIGGKRLQPPVEFGLRAELLVVALLVSRRSWRQIAQKARKLERAVQLAQSL